MWSNVHLDFHDHGRKVIVEHDDVPLPRCHPVRARKLDSRLKRH
jgi:hypothetical protein